LPKSLRKHYTVKDILDPDDWDMVVARVDLVVSRSGANTVSALLYLKTPAILVPIPKTHRDEQLKNARFAEEFGIARVTPQSDFNSENLISAVETTLKNAENIKLSVKNKTSPDVGASKRFVDIILKYL
jgi:UDP-N-acetylglucosamine--N-acetylmuramyl-(pentapeptide) pyrophosphoryl-undecaprenol N-acetylglucosamine transferase